MSPRILVAGIGNIFLGDDGFGCAVARALLARGQRPGVRVVDFGIRGFDLASALAEPLYAAVLVDIVQRGEPPGTLCVLEPRLEGEAPAQIEGHRLDPVRVLALARTLGAEVRRLRLVGCEPARLPAPDADPDELMGELSASVAAAVEPAVVLIEQLVMTLSEEGSDA
jgi:hydrogenase maturation protease